MRMVPSSPLFQMMEQQEKDAATQRREGQLRQQVDKGVKSALREHQSLDPASQEFANAVLKRQLQMEGLRPPTARPTARFTTSPVPFNKGRK